MFFSQHVQRKKEDYEGVSSNCIDEAAAVTRDNTTGGRDGRNVGLPGKDGLADGGLKMVGFRVLPGGNTVG